MRLAAKQCRGEPRVAHGVQRLGNIAVDPGKPLKIAVDHRLRLVRRNAEPLSKPPARNAIKDRKIDGLCPPARVAVDLSEQLHRGQAVDVIAIRERDLQRRDIGHMRRQPQLDLAIVSGQQHMPRLGDKRLPDTAACFAADRDILQIWIVRAEPPGLRPGQAVTGVDPARRRVDLLLQRIGVG